MNDILPLNKLPGGNKSEAICRDLSTRYGYREIRFPVMVEQTALFARGIGDANRHCTEKEMYTFTDRNGDSLSLRPEGTASCVRAGIQHGLFYNQVQRIMVFQDRCRCMSVRKKAVIVRISNNLGVEAYGMAGPDIDAEIILLGQRLLTQSD